MKQTRKQAKIRNPAGAFRQYTIYSEYTLYTLYTQARKNAIMRPLNFRKSALPVWHGVKRGFFMRYSRPKMQRLNTRAHNGATVEALAGCLCSMRREMLHIIGDESPGRNGKKRKRKNGRGDGGGVSI